MDIETAAVEVCAAIGFVGALGEVEIVPVALRLVWLHAGSTNRSGKQSAGG